MKSENSELRTSWFLNEINESIKNKEKTIHITTHTRIFDIKSLGKELSCTLVERGTKVSGLLRYHILHVPFYGKELVDSHYYGTLCDLKEIDHTFKLSDIKRFSG